MDHSDLTWRKSSRSGNGGEDNCVEVAWLPATTAVRDSKNPAADHLQFPTSAWTAFRTRP